MKPYNKAVTSEKYIQLFEMFEIKFSISSDTLFNLLGGLMLLVTILVIFISVLCLSSICGDSRGKGIR